MNEATAALLAEAQLARNEGRLVESLQAYEGALRLLRSADDPLARAHTARHVADVLRELGRLEAAQVAIREALDLYRDRTDVGTLERANTLRVAALVEEALGRPGAVELWRQACALYEASSIAPGVAECRQHLGEG